MFETIWANRPRWEQEADALSKVKPAPPVDRDIEAVALLDWAEHCLECAPPQCYRDCPLYFRRADLKCKRMDYGLYPDPRFGGLYGYGIDCRFRQWAKIECYFNPRAYSPKRLRRIDRWTRGLAAISYGISSVLKPISPSRKPVGVFVYLRSKLIPRLGRGVGPPFDAFLLECYSLEDAPFRLTMQVDQKGTLLYRGAFELQPGHNRFEVPFGQFGLDPRRAGARVYLCPENDLPARIVFTWLDFVRFRSGSRTRPEPAAPPADKVKCVAWDLDNTLWKGILVESGPEGIVLNEEAVEVIRRLDERGIIHTIVSKNTYDQAWPIIEAAGLGDYFVYPAVNWGPKSANLREVARRINIGLDTFALVDDSPFERAEVASELSMVRVFSEREIDRLCSLPEFDVPVTEMSRQRRASYLAEMKRESLQASVGGDDLAFLRSCGMTMEVFTPSADAEKKRCLELVQRSNQLNLSAHRYTSEEFDALLANPALQCLGFRCRDRFGEYGIVGFISIRKDPVPQIVDLVISCRVAKKRVEHRLIDWLGRQHRARGKETLTATLLRTDRNNVLAEVFAELPFQIVSEDERAIRYTLDLLADRPPEDVVSLRAREEDA